ncbi:hypothetical protein P692DRAFT_20874197 [Suillus brevipes Sb2]|nr:hypothetical protein P692DRAFT_20874197 [Suillus brevipes Sb2]
MASDSDSDSRSVDSRPSIFNDGAEAILADTIFKVEAPSGREGDNQSRSSTPESHKDCKGNAHGQGAPVYSCGCYKYKRMDSYQYFNQPQSPYQPLEFSDSDPGDIVALSPKRKIRDDNDTLSNVFQDITNVRAASEPVIKLRPSKRRKLVIHSELLEGGLAQSLAEVAHEIAAMRESLDRVKKVLVGKACNL